jgi:glycosyltransferase involved in cell wall biosynthesis
LNEPHRSGIQRVIKEFSRECLNSKYEYRYYSICFDTPKYVSSVIFDELINYYWENLNANFSHIQRQFKDSAQSFSFSSNGANANLRIEPSFNRKIVEHFMELPQNVKTTTIVYDTFPMTKPNFYSGNGFTANSLYFRSLMKKQNIVTNYELTKIQIENLIRNGEKELGEILVVPLGADHFHKIERYEDLNQIPEIIMLGTLDPRKKHRVIFDALKIVNAKSIKFRVTFIGKESYHNVDLFNYFKELDNPWFRWVRDASDSEISWKLENSQILVLLGEEGFGLPAFEAWQKGCLVIFGGIQPAAELLQAKGALKLPDEDTDSIAKFFDKYAEGNYEKLKLAISSMSKDALPTWRNFVDQVESLYRQ